MSNLHDHATRVVTIALFPAFVALGVVTWQVQQPPVVTAQPAELAPPPIEEPIVVPPAQEAIPPKVAEPTVPPPRALAKPKPAEPAPVEAPEKERHCDEVALYGGAESVRICQWE